MTSKPSPSSASKSFNSLALSPDLLAVVAELGFEHMTPVQAESIPLLLAGKDLIAQSKTGSGKTAAFTLPILEKIDLSYRNVQALILCPTRELCTQVAREVRRLGRRHPRLQVLIVSGGQPGRPQSIALARGVHIVVGTPGRVVDLIERGRLDLNDVTTLVLDEADRMLEMGFEEEMTLIMDEVPGTRQTVMFSATYPASIMSLSKRYQHSPARVTIDEANEERPLIRQLVYNADEDQKLNVLLKVLRQHRPGTALVFCNLKTTVAELDQKLRAQGLSSAALHGDLEQRDRDIVMAKFRGGSARILVATDVAARGLDIADLDMVINYDLPHQDEVYVHRIGRTGRAGKTGVSVSLAAPREVLGRLAEIEEYTGVTMEDGEKAERATPARAESSPHASAMQTLMISGGRKQKVRPGDILGALTGEAGGFQASDIGKIEIHDVVSYVAVSASIAKSALECLRNGRIKGQKFLISLVK